MHILRDPERRLVIAHRGASALAPENTLPAFRLAMEIGVDAFELDLHLSADGIPVVIHDPTLDRTTDRAGIIAQLTVQQIQGADAGARCVGRDGSRWIGRGVTIPTLDEVLDTFPTMPLLLEIKARAARFAVAHTIARHRAEDRIVVASFDHGALDTFRNSAIAVGASRRDILRLFLGGRLHLPIPVPPVACFAVPDSHRGLEVPTARVVRRARSKGVPVHVWTVDDPERARTLWERGVSGIITNDPAELR